MASGAQKPKHRCSEVRVESAEDIEEIEKQFSEECVRLCRNEDDCCSVSICLSLFNIVINLCLFGLHWSYSWSCSSCCMRTFV